MKSMRFLFIASTFVMAACGAADQTISSGLAAQDGQVKVHGSEADRLSNALMAAGVERKLGDMNMSFVVVNQVTCKETSATAGNPVCTISTFVGNASAIGATAQTLFEVLSAHGLQSGSAHGAGVTASVSSVCCINSLSGRPGLTHCTLQL